MVLFTIGVAELKAGDTGVGFTVIVLLAETGAHVPPLAVKVRAAVPEKSTGGVHVAFKVLAPGVKVPPDTVDHVALVASPTIAPPRPDVVLP